MMMYARGQGLEVERGFYIGVGRSIGYLYCRSTFNYVRVFNVVRAIS
jgi:hypothetical protein